MYSELLFAFSFLTMLHLIHFSSSWYDPFLMLVSLLFSPVGVVKTRRADRASNADPEATFTSGIPPAQGSWSVRITVTVVDATCSEANSLVSVDHSPQGAQVDDSVRVSPDVRTVDASLATASAPAFAPFYGVSYRKPRSPAPPSSTVPPALLSLGSGETYRVELNSADHIAQVSFDMDHDLDIIGAWLARMCGVFAGRLYPPVPFSSDPFDQSATEGKRVFMRLDLLVQPETTDLGIHYVILVVEIVPSHESSTVFTVVDEGESGHEVRRIGFQFHGVFATVDDFVMTDWQSGGAPLGCFLSDDYQRLGQSVRWEKESDAFLRLHDILEQKSAHDELCAVWQERLGGRMDASEAYYHFQAEESREQCRDDGDHWDDDSIVNAPLESVRSWSSLNENASALDFDCDCDFDSFGSSCNVDDSFAKPLGLDFDCFGSGYSLDEVTSNYSSPPRTPRSDPFSTSACPPNTSTPRTPQFRGCQTSLSAFSLTPLAGDLLDDPFFSEPSSFCMPRTAAA